MFGIEIKLVFDMLSNHKYNHNFYTGFIYEPIIYNPSLWTKNFQSHRLWIHIVRPLILQNFFMIVLSHKDYENTGKVEITMHLSDSRKHLRRSNWYTIPSLGRNWIPFINILYMNRSLVSHYFNHFSSIRSSNAQSFLM